MQNLARFRDFLKMHMRWLPLTPAGVVRAIVLGDNCQSVDARYSTVVKDLDEFGTESTHSK